MDSTLNGSREGKMPVIVVPLSVCLSHLPITLLDFSTDYF